MAKEIKVQETENTEINKEEVKMKVKNGLKKAGKIVLLVGGVAVGYLLGKKAGKTDSDTYNDECGCDEPETPSDVTEF